MDFQSQNIENIRKKIDLFIKKFVFMFKDKNYYIVLISYL